LLPDARAGIDAEAYSDHVSGEDDAAVEEMEPRVAAAVVDVFVYVVVLNLFIEYLPRVISETFTLSVLTAVLLKGVLEVVVVAKNRVKKRFRQAATPIGKAVAAVMLWVVLFGSKFLVLEVVGLVFGNRVSLGGFVSVTLLILALLLSRAAVRRLLLRPRRRAERQGRQAHGSAGAVEADTLEDPCTSGGEAARG